MSHDNLRKRCDWLLTSLVGADAVHAWWESPNRAFDMRTPSQAWEEDPMSVYTYLMYFITR